jgi:hypothetical protein
MPDQSSSGILNVKTPSDAEVARLYPEDEGAHGLLSEAYGPENTFSAMPSGIAERLEELRGLIDTDTTVTLARDWEGCAFAIVEGDERFDVLAFTDAGEVGHGGINHPLYFDTFAALLQHDRARQGK